MRRSGKMREDQANGRRGMEMEVKKLLQAARQQTTGLKRKKVWLFGALAAIVRITAAGMAQAEIRDSYVDIQVGDIIEFGSYEQDNDSSNGSEPIKWRVLEVSDGSALVVSEYALDVKVYNEAYESVTWETCKLRAWLNEEFYDTAFGMEEKALIAMTKVGNEDHPMYGTNGGKDTEDWVFLLSIGEAERYFEDDEDRRTFPTEYAIARDAYVYSDLGTVWWWLRSPGYHGRSAAEVSSFGALIYNGASVYNYKDGVRPALRIEIVP